MQLIVKAAQSSFYRTGVVILHEYVGNSTRGESCLVIAFDKEAAGVAEDIGTKLPDIGERCRDLLQANGSHLLARVPKPSMTLSEFQIRGISLGVRRNLSEDRHLGRRNTRVRAISQP